MSQRAPARAAPAAAAAAAAAGGGGSSRRAARRRLRQLRNQLRDPLAGHVAGEQWHAITRGRTAAPPPVIAASCGATAVLLPLLSAVGAVTVDRWLRRRHQLRVRSRLQSTPAPGPQDDGPEKVRRRREASQALSYKLSHFQHAQRRGGGGDDDDGSTIVLQEEGADDLGLLAAMADADADDCGGGGGGGPGGLPAVVRVVAVGTGGHIPGGWTTGRMLLDLASVSTTHPRTLSIPVIPPRISIDRGPTPPPDLRHFYASTHAPPVACL